jgi:queuine tRNA-ribosyltransferase
MGVGTPVNLLESWALGIDMTDCVMPTRNARHGLLFTWEGKMNLHNAKYKNDFAPIDEKSALTYDRKFSRAYLRHLLNAQEILGYIITSVHNLYFYLELSRMARQHILNGTFGEWKADLVPKLDRKL